MSTLSSGSLSAIIVAVFLVATFILEFLRWCEYSVRNKNILESDKIRINQELDQVINDKLVQCDPLSINRNKIIITTLMGYIMHQFRDLKG
ncbi:MAG: hypothetical protein ACTJLM_01600 [Ehrlichia sp.]